MIRLPALVLFACTGVAVVLADSPKPVFLPKAPLNNPVDVAAVKQIEVEMGDAMVAVDIDKLNQIFADNWATITPSGQTLRIAAQKEMIRCCASLPNADGLYTWRS